MITDTKVRILGFIRTNGQARVKDLVEHLGLGNVAIHRQLRTLVDLGKLAKSGTPPKVFYRLALVDSETKQVRDQQTTSLLDRYYAYVDPTGRLLSGWSGFQAWARNVHKANEIDSLLARYAEDRQKINRWFTPQGWIEATTNVAQTFPDDMNLAAVYYLDFYSLPSFGKTRLGTLVLHAKQSENKQLIWQIADEAAPLVDRLIRQLKIDAVGFIPHSILRRIQFLKEFSRKLNLPLPQIDLVKAYAGNIRVAQKSLGRLEERITNARETIFVGNPGVKYDRVLLIDDAVGSGATLNETAKKLKSLGIAEEVFGFAVVGSLKGFEVIREA